MATLTALKALLVFLVTIASALFLVKSEDTNKVYSPCLDTTVQVSDGFTFAIAFSSRTSFFFNSSRQLSPCDRRLALTGQNSQISVFRPKVDEISLLTINTSSFYPENYGGYMVAFAGRKYAARSLPAFVANNTHTVTSFTLVLEFKKGRLQNLYWKRDGCAKCSGNSNFVCLNNQDCAIRTSLCKNNGGSVDCSLGIQLAFSGTDKHFSALNSWYEVENLRQYSFMVFTQISRILSPVSIARSSNCDLMVCRVLVSSYVVIFSSSLFQMVQTLLVQLMLLFVVSLQSCAV